MKSIALKSNLILHAHICLGAYLSPLGLVLAVFGEQVTQYVGAAAGHVHQRALLPQTEPGGDGQHQRDGLDDQGPLPQVASDDEAAEDGFNLREGENRRIWDGEMFTFGRDRFRDAHSRVSTERKLRTQTPKAGKERSLCWGCLSSK